MVLSMDLLALEETLHLPLFVQKTVETETLLAEKDVTTETMMTGMDVIKIVKLRHTMIVRALLLSVAHFVEMATCSWVKLVTMEPQTWQVATQRVTGLYEAILVLGEILTIHQFVMISVGMAL